MLKDKPKLLYFKQLQRFCVQRSVACMGLEDPKIGQYGKKCFYTESQCPFFKKLKTQPKNISNTVKTGN